MATKKFKKSPNLVTLLMTLVLGLKSTSHNVFLIRRKGSADEREREGEFRSE